MCGIAGFLARDPASDTHAILSRQLRTLDHRGPDSAGAVVRGPAAIGQTRLAVIDLEHGDPPISNEDGTVSVAFNGEIYNYRSLRAMLTRRGHRLATEGDTEVLAHLAEHLPAVDLARRLEGMFAFAVWDDRSEELTLVRDRFGKKPLYYWAALGMFVFASEIKGVLAHPDVPRRMNDRALEPYLALGYVPTPETFYAGVLSLPAGHVLRVSAGGVPRCEPYWDPLPSPAGGAGARKPTFGEAAAATKALMREAVESRMVSDVPLGAYLSGGIDSTIVVGLMAQATPHPVSTFTIGFEDDEGHDERPFAALAAERLGTDHHEFVVNPDAVELIEELVDCHDQPFGDSSAIPTYLLARLTRGHVTVALSGDGGDELFAGYERFAAALLLRRYALAPRALRHAVDRGLAAFPAGPRGSYVESLRRFARRTELPLPGGYLSWLAYLPAEVREDMLGRADGGAPPAYREMWERSTGLPLLTRLLDLNVRTYLLDDLLVKADRASMAHSLEVRSPFLDHRLAEYVLGLPPSYLLRGTTLKRVLRAAFADLVPPEVAKRRKRGFGVPLDRWFRADLRDYVSNRLGPGACVNEHLEPSAIARYLDEHLAGRRNNGHGLWALLTLEVFLRREGW